MNQHFRLFFAIQLPLEVVNLCVNIQKQLQSEGWSKKIQWSTAKNLHITLRFIGDSDPKQLIKLKEEVRNNISALPQFPIEYGSLRLFPNSQHPGAVVIIISPSKDLFHLVSQIETGVIAAGYKKETRAYLPHLTLGRTNAYSQLKTIEFTNISIPNTKVSEIYLLNSVELNAARIYQTVETFPLQSF